MTALSDRVAVVTGASSGWLGANPRRARPDRRPVNDAGYSVWKSLEATSMAEWDQTFAVNVRAAAYLCAAVLPDMQARGFGRVINIGSETGVAIVPGLAAYGVSKHDTDMGYVIPGANPANFLRVDEVVEVVRFLLYTGDNVKIGPAVLVRTMRNPMSA